MHCNLRQSDAAPVLVRFNYDAHAKFEVAQPIRCRLIFDLMTLNMYHVLRYALRVCKKFKLSQAIRS